MLGGEEIEHLILDGIERTMVFVFGVSAGLGGRFPSRSPADASLLLRGRAVVAFASECSDTRDPFSYRFL